jgi:pyrroloquinoline quinone biosynthesis protein E
MIRAEENALLIWDQKTAGMAYINGAELRAVEAWARSGAENAFCQRLRQYGLTLDRAETVAALDKARLLKAPPRAFAAPESLHVELTTACPWRCAQCYKGWSKRQDMDWARLMAVLTEARQMRVFQVALGGGEPLRYPRLPELVENITRRGMAATVTTSGHGLEKALPTLRAAGLAHVQVSLNATTAALNARSREGFTVAMAALRRLKTERNLSFGINWVARPDNLADLPAMFELVRKLGAHNLNILRLKPGPEEAYRDLNREEALTLLAHVEKARGIRIKVDSSYAALQCAINGRTSFMGGCGAGRRFVAVDAAGRFRPCSHAGAAEDTISLAAFWQDSAQLAAFRQDEERLGEPCRSCAYLIGCRGCRAARPGAASQAGMKDCPFARARD